jgi:hypothetical protein
MLRPSKHSHPDRSVIAVSLLLLTQLRECRIEEYGKLLKFAKERVGGGEFLFVPALNFLYLIGLIEYRPKTDVVEYVGPR